MTTVPVEKSQPLASWPLTVLAAVLYALGWVAAVAWSALAWCVAAVRVGWSEGVR